MVQNQCREIGRKALESNIVAMTVGVFKGMYKKIKTRVLSIRFNPLTTSLIALCVISTPFLLMKSAPLGSPQPVHIYSCHNEWDKVHSGGITSDINAYLKILPNSIVTCDESKLTDVTIVFSEELPRNLNSKIICVFNVEWVTKSFDFDRCDRVFVKTEHTMVAFSTAMSPNKIRYVRHTNMKPFVYNELNYSQAIHFAGRSPYKNTDLLIRAWIKSKITTAHLTITCFTACYPSMVGNVLKYATAIFGEDFIHPIKYEDRIEYEEYGITIYTKPISESAFEILQNSAGFAICPSSVEGYGMYIDENRPYGRVILTTDLPPMNELVNAESGYLVPVYEKRSFWAAQKFSDWDLEAVLKEEDIKRTLKMMFEDSKDVWKEKGSKVRKAAKEDREFWKSKVKEEIEELRKEFSEIKSNFGLKKF